MSRFLFFFFTRRRICAAVALLSVFALLLFGTPWFQPFASAHNLGGSKAFRGQSLAASSAKSSGFGRDLGTANSPEILLAPENDASRFEGNKRILNRTGFPAAIYNGDFRVEAGHPETQARQYLDANRTLLGLSSDDIKNLNLHHIRTDDAGTVVRLRQMWKGLPVNKNAEITIHINRANVVDFVMNGFEYGVRIEDVSPLIPAEAARSQVADRLGNAYDETAKGTSDLMILHHQKLDHLVYRVSFISDAPVGEWEAFVDAKTGSLLKLEDVALYRRSKRSNDSNAVLATGTGNVFDPDPLTTAMAAYGGSYVDGSDANAAVLTAQLKNVTLPDITLNAGTYSLVGPYAEIRDFEAPNKGLFTQASATFNFDRNADAFEAVNTYYHIDSMMRYLNTTLGLSIMPYQYAGGVRFDPSGLNGADNSHYISGSGSLAFGEGGVDDAEDADVIIHELGHGLHDWVTVGGLSQVNGLSEGIGDYIAGSYSRFKGYWTSGQPAFDWTFNWDGHNPFWGGRVLNYSAIYPGGLTGAIHTDGQIWATANMKVWDDIGGQKTDKAFWSGLAMTNATTNQNDAANAVFTAATNLGYTLAERTAMRNRYIAAGYTIPAIPTAANASVSGRVLTANGSGIRNAVVTLVDASGTVRTARTSTFGYYRFDGVEVGGSYAVNVVARRFSFANPTQIIAVDDNVADLNFTAEP